MLTPFSQILPGERPCTLKINLEETGPDRVTLKPIEGACGQRSKVRPITWVAVLVTY